MVLFYQYVEPQWSKKEHRESLKYVINLGKSCCITGRGRCAAEGLNCTLTGPPEALRRFCNGLREWQPALFNETDFKFTDGLPLEHAFKALTIQKTADLVAYGLPSEVAPNLGTSQARHVEADEYHKLMHNPDAVIIDVRNVYESAIGHFQPPEGGATFIDPRMRNSVEFPKWLNAPETQEKLHGKQVLMYCTGGIRCERASALLDAMARTSNGAFEVKDTVMVRGGIERYIKTFPEGGYWKGKNYLFDKRFEQHPEAKSEAALAQDVESYCCVCHKACDYYMGNFHCGGWLEPTQSKCHIPVIVCKTCAQTKETGGLDVTSLRCPLCEEGFYMPTAKPNLAELRQSMRQNVARDGGGALHAVSAAGGGNSGRASGKRARHEARDAQAATLPPSMRLVVGNLPFLMAGATEELSAALLAVVRGERPPVASEWQTKAEKDAERAQKRHRRLMRNAAAGSKRAQEALRLEVHASGSVGKSGGLGTVAAGGADAKVERVRWLTDKASGLFYGSALVQLSTQAAATALVRAATCSAGDAHDESVGLRLRGRRIRVHYAPTQEDEEW
jgi:predicted sulfurtransferase